MMTNKNTYWWWRRLWHNKVVSQLGCTPISID